MKSGTNSAWSEGKRTVQLVLAAIIIAACGGKAENGSLGATGATGGQAGVDASAPDGGPAGGLVGGTSGSAGNDASATGGSSDDGGEGGDHEVGDGAGGAAWFDGSGCPFHSPWQACDDCVSAECMNECSWCTQNSGCLNLLLCLDDCAWNDAACIKDCEAKFPNGVQSLKPLLGDGQCARSMCSVVCPWTDAGAAGAAGSGGSESEGGTGGTAGSSGAMPCGYSSCNLPETCCFLTGTCFDPSSSPSSCPTAPNGYCASNADCAAGEFCRSAQRSCAGPGLCVSVSDCIVTPGLVCGCDGHTYWSDADACYAKERVLFGGECGSELKNGYGKTVIPCGDDQKWCPAGQACCPITGWCYDPAEPLLCVEAPTGATLPCIHDSDCWMASEFCVGIGCGTPGGCVAQGSCTGELNPVCGCDGKTYTNQACAWASRVVVAYTGDCGDAGK